MVQTSDVGFALAVYTSSFGAGLVKTDRYGNIEWNQTYGEPHGEVTWCVQQTSHGGYAIAGETYTFGFLEDIPNYDFWLFKTESMYHEAEKNVGIPPFLL